MSVHRRGRDGKLRRVHRRFGAPLDPDTSGLVRRCRRAFESAERYSMTGPELLVAVVGESEARITFGDPALWGHEMARLLRPYGIRPMPTRVKTATGSRSTTGYRVEQFGGDPRQRPTRVEAPPEREHQQHPGCVLDVWGTLPEPATFELADLTPEDVEALRRTEFGPAVAALERAGLITA